MKNNSFKDMQICEQNAGDANLGAKWFFLHGTDIMLICKDLKMSSFRSRLVEESWPRELAGFEIGL